MLRNFIARSLFGLCMAVPMLQSVQGQAYGLFDNDACLHDACESSCERFWVDADYLYWKIQDSPESTVLVIDQPLEDGPFTPVLGGKKVDLGWRSGGRFTLGYWFDECQCWGAEVGYFFLGDRSKKFAVASDANGSPRLRVPYFNVETGKEDSSALATPGLYKGYASLKYRNSMQGAEVNLVKPFSSCDCNTRFGLLAGFRWWNFDEHLKFFGDSPLVSPATIYNYHDKFHVENNFYGGQIGASLDYSYCSFFVNVKAKIGLGAICQESIIEGEFTTDEFPGGLQTFEGGFFAEPTNIGHHKKTRFSVLPELDLNFGYQVSDCLRLQIGYSVLYVTNVLYAGKQIDRNINPTQSVNIEFDENATLVGIPSPKAKMSSEGLWAQGINAGIEFKF